MKRETSNVKRQMKSLRDFMKTKKVLKLTNEKKQERRAICIQNNADEPEAAAAEEKKS